MGIDLHVTIARQSCRMRTTSAPAVFSRTPVDSSNGEFRDALPAAMQRLIVEDLIPSTVSGRPKLPCERQPSPAQRLKLDVPFGYRISLLLKRSIADAVQLCPSSALKSPDCGEGHRQAAPRESRGRVATGQLWQSFALDSEPLCHRVKVGTHIRSLCLFLVGISALPACPANGLDADRQSGFAVTSWHFLEALSARPPEMMILAEVNSGQSVSKSVLSMKTERPGSAAAEIFSTAAALPWEALGNEAVRTVITFLSSVDCTAWMALQA